MTCHQEINAYYSGGFSIMFTLKLGSVALTCCKYWGLKAVHLANAQSCLHKFVNGLRLWTKEPQVMKLNNHWSETVGPNPNFYQGLAPRAK